MYQSFACHFHTRGFEFMLYEILMKRIGLNDMDFCRIMTTVGLMALSPATVQLLGAILAGVPRVCQTTLCT